MLEPAEFTRVMLVVKIPTPFTIAVMIEPAGDPTLG